MQRQRGVAIAAAAVILLGGASPAGATSLETHATRPNDVADTRLYVPLAASFVAESDEALLTLARPTGDCYASGQLCSDNTQCPSGVCRNGNCQYPESVQVGYVAVLRLADYCNIAACGPNPLPPECLSGTCDGSSCAVPTSRVNGLCLCASCNETDPLLTPAEAPFVETFADFTDPRWMLEQSSFLAGGSRSFLKFLKPEYPVANQPMSTPIVGLAQIRIHGLVAGQTYMVVAKWTFSPYPAPVACVTYSGLSLSVAPTASVCAP
ncbi:MAG TPA: hypothetical protein VJV75_12695 [Candidatus Polarisedimenticolia bacterium]|nr:hypothetical protein [Candidatus Polarisedimenticolia bacterium]